MKNKLKRTASFLSAVLFAVTSFSSCAVQTVSDEPKYVPSEAKPEIADIAYTGGKFELADKDGLYESFDNIDAGTVYGTGDSESGTTVGSLNFVPKLTKFDIAKSIDGNALHYTRSQNADKNKKDPYIDVNINKKIGVEKYIAQVDLMLADDYALSPNIIQAIYRKEGASLISLSAVSCNKKGEILSYGTVIGKLSKTEYTNIAVLTDPISLTYIVYINGVEKTSGSFERNNKKYDLTGYYFAQTRYIQAGNNCGTGGLYIDNIAVCSGDIPPSFVPSDDISYTVNENFNSVSNGSYTSNKIRFDTKTVDATVKTSDDKNRFISCKLKSSASTVNFTETLLSGGDYTVSGLFYRKSDSAGFSVMLGDNELCTVDKNGRLTYNGSTLSRTETESWQRISASVSKSGFTVYLDGQSVFTQSIDLSKETGKPTLKIFGSTDETVFFDDIAIYRAKLPIEYSGNKKNSFVLMDSSKADILSGTAEISVEDESIGSNGKKLIKLDGLNNAGRILKFTASDSGFTDSAQNYSTVRLRFYCPEEYNYSLLVLIDCGMTAKGWGYFSDYILLDERGWVTAELKISEMDSNRSPSLSTFSSVTFETSGWGFGKTQNVKETESAQNGEVVIYLESIEFVKK